MRAVALRLLLPALVAACAPAAVPGPGLPLARATLDPDAAGLAQGEARFTVTPTRGGRPVPARCEARGEGFSAAFAAPAELAAPVFGAASAPIRVTCAASDGARGAQTAAPGYRRSGGVTGVYPTLGFGVSTGGDVGVSVGGWWDGLAPRRADAYGVRYPDLVIPLD